MKIGFFESSLSLKFVVLVAVVLSITMGTSSYYTISLETEKHTQELIDKANLLADVVSLISPEEIYAFDFYTLNEHVKNVSLKNNVIYCAIKDNSGEYITSFLNKNDSLIKKYINKYQSNDLNIIIPLVDQEENIITVRKQIVYNGDVLGDVYLGISTIKIIELHDQSIRQQLLLSFGVILVLSALIYSIFRQSALNRINELISSFEAVTLGNFDQKVNIQNKDELSQLGAAFNAMIETLKNSIGLKELALNKVKELNKTLENKVQDRTEELKETNDVLFIQQKELRHHRDNLQDLVDEQMADIIKEKEKVEVASAAKTEFLANMSHELRTPLHAILSFSKFGMGKTGKISSDKVINYFVKIKQSGDRLLHLVNDLLDLEKLESGVVELNLTVINLLDIYGQINDEFELIYSEKTLTVTLHCEEKEILVRCDRQKIEQVYRNLISNAVKFSNRNSQIDVNIYDLDEYIKLSVTNCGVGIPEGELTDVFDKFIQSSKTKNGSGGTGLGLPISKQIIDLHGGEIVAENGLDGGVKFWFKLPKNII